ncbi:PilZ domain-containing protein [Methylogaea oryzae]|uniref:PilZ domain-containing protein n=1 Tax=Methylogaea oryzae TaxID=1295382 RepID=UPI0012E0D54E|nr:PilZ domain-containing protein [Methylogaea oryzae]
MNEQRQHYRKSLRLIGYMERKDGEREFQLQDLSLGGLRAHFDDDPALIVGQQVHIRLPGLGLRGMSFPLVRPLAAGGFDVGFDFAALDGEGENLYRYRAGESGE